MKKLAVIVLAFTLASCATVRNPVTQTDLATVEAGYGVALSLAVAYRHLPLCRTGTTASLSNVCARRSVVVKLQQADRSVQTALSGARNFIKNNPTLSAGTFISAAQAALASFQAIEATYGVGQ